MKKLFAFLLCFVLLSACARQAPPADTTPPATSTDGTTIGASNLTGKDAANTYLVNDNFQCLTESDSAIYKLVSSRDFILYYDKGSGNSGPLCSKPDCDHTGNECDAYVCGASSLQYYDGSLYFVALDPNTFPIETWLWKSDASGKNREKIKQLDRESIIYYYQPQSFIIHRGNLYLFCIDSKVENGAAFYHATLLSSPVDSSTQFTVLWEQEENAVLQLSYRFGGQYIYLAIKEGANNVKIIRLNTLDGTIETLFTEVNQGYYYGEIHLTKQNELYLCGSDATAVYAWKIENGEKTDTVIIESDSNFPPKILDGLVIDTRQNEDNKRVATVKTLSGETVYEGLLFPNGIPEIEAELDLNTCNYGEVGGTGSLIAFYMGADGNGSKPAEYVVYLDTAQNMKPIYIFPC